jgi:Domain of unknown function (DUF4263)
MAAGTWEDAVERLSDAVQDATPEQHALAKQIGVTIPKKTPAVIAAAILRSTLSKQLLIPVEAAIRDHFATLLKSLKKETSLSVKPANDEEAEAWVEYLRLVRRKRCLEALKPEAGDIVDGPYGEMVEVSSIGDDGRVYFKGGKGFRSWPDLITKVAARKGDNSAKAKRARVAASNVAAQRASSPEWSAARSEDLEEFAVWKPITEKAIDDLEDVIDAANDEKPVQKFLEANPQLLTSLLGGKERFCIPQKRLGAEFIPDFVLGDVDSMGVRWILVELETPKAGIYLKGGKQLDEFARKGKDQIIDWRGWLTNNIDYAQRSRRKTGLGLPDISNYSEGLVLVGRSALMPKTTDAARKELRYSSNIRVHSYDRLLKLLRGAINFDGPPSNNPFLLARMKPEDDPSYRPR